MSRQIPAEGFAHDKVPSLGYGRSMAKGYWIVRLDVHDVDRFKEYLGATPSVLGQHGGRFLARGGQYEAVEGQGRTRNSVIEFPSYQAALDCYRSEAYQAAKKLRLGAADMELSILEGVAPDVHVAT